MATIRYNIPYTNVPAPHSQYKSPLSGTQYGPSIQSQSNLSMRQTQYSLSLNQSQLNQLPGELIDNNPDREKVYNIFINYYENPFFYKLKDVAQNVYVNTPSHSMYVCKIASGTTIDKRYIICITPVDIYPVMHRMPMCDLKWESLQARTLQENMGATQLPLHSYRFKRESPYNALINRSTYEDTYTEYVCDSLPLKVTMLHKSSTSKAPDKFEYISVEKSILNVALEQYSTVITFV